MAERNGTGVMKNAWGVMDQIKKTGPKKCAWCGALIDIKNGRLTSTGGDDPGCLCHVKENKNND